MDLPAAPSEAASDTLTGSRTHAAPLYRRWANHYLEAIHAGSLAPGDRMPSVRNLMRLHGVSLSTAIQICRQLEADGWLEARPRSGYFVRRPHRLPIAPAQEPDLAALDPASYVGIHVRVSDFVAKRHAYPVRINLGGACGEPALYPGEKLRQAALRALRHHPEMLVTAPRSGGSLDLRTVLAKRGVPIGLAAAPEDVLITHGCIEALNLALRAVAQPGDTIAVESPTFYGLLQILESLGLRALEIPTSPHTGISVEALELAIRTYDNIKAVAVIPNLQNPLGSIMPDAHKARLVELCERHGIPIIEDDTYGELCKGDAPPRALKAWDRSGNVIYCASLHKILAPGMRLGWMTAGRFQERVAMIKFAQTRQNEEWPQLAVAEFMASSAYDRHLRGLRQALHGQRERTAGAIAAFFPAGTRLSTPEGGLTLWVELPAGVSADALFLAALREGILIAPGRLFSNSGRFDNFIRINCGNRYTQGIEDGLRRLGQIVEVMAQRGTGIKGFAPAG